ncbi:hypothetical protein CS022_24085 [Veronia nyctiphanis]|uniref:Uncharacterized protein n=1 Tax=Veronia nyctiphanis TaxID=1278244 RepID=A0A4Q0YHX1_9GAMM|nr:hypothetical protein CS022_24085 [Veronia nyctiphanis]
MLAAVCAAVVGCASPMTYDEYRAKTGGFALPKIAGQDKALVYVARTEAGTGRLETDTAYSLNGGDDT